MSTYAYPNPQAIFYQQYNMARRDEEGPVPPIDFRRSLPARAGAPRCRENAGIDGHAVYASWPGFDPAIPNVTNCVPCVTDRVNSGCGVKARP